MLNVVVLKENLLNPLAMLGEQLKDKVEAVDICLSQHIYSELRELPDISYHIINSGGKRLRPLLTLAAAELCGYNGGDRDIKLAACIELLHTATLLHDDVVDESRMRRGRATANVIWGNQLSILGGDFLFSKMFELLVQDGSIDILNLFVKTTQTLIEGEVLQIKSRLGFEVDEGYYFKAIESKTASLFQSALVLGALIAGADAVFIQLLKAYGYNIGIAFQMVDDALDYASDISEFGKVAGNDFFEGQMTLPIIYLFEALKEDQLSQMRLKHMFLEEKRTQEDLVWVQAQLTHYNIRDKILDQARIFAQKAYILIKDIPNHPVKDSLLNLTAFVVERCN